MHISECEGCIGFMSKSGNVLRSTRILSNEVTAIGNSRYEIQTGMWSYLVN